MNNFIKKSIAGMLVAILSTLAFAGEKSGADDAIAFVKKAINHIKMYGPEKSFVEFNRMDSPFNTMSDLNKKGDLYVFVMNGDGIEVAHGKNPKMQGKNLIDLRDSEGIYLQREMLKACDSKDGKGWVDYKWPNPITKVVEQKSSYVEKFGGFCIGTGIYK
jgi:signal transduction histidine kinase